MKNYKVKTIMKFTDKEENTKRIVDDEFECTKERYEYLKSKGAVTLVEIVDEIVDNVVEEVTDDTVDEVVNELFEKKRKKKKKSNKK